MSAEVFWGLVGVIISIATFWLGYRQTVGARKERIRSADTTVEEVTLRRLILDDWNPTYLDLEKLIAGHALSNNIPATTLRRPEELSTVLLARLLGNDLLPSADRNRIVTEVLLPISEPRKAGELDSSEQADGDQATARPSAPEKLPKYSLRQRAPFISGQRLIPFLAVLALLIGTTATGLITLLLNKEEPDPKWSDQLTIILSAVGGLAFLVLTTFVLSYQLSSNTVNNRAQDSFAAAQNRLLGRPLTNPKDKERAQKRAAELASFPRDTDDLNAGISALESISPIAAERLGLMARRHLDAMKRSSTPASNFIVAGGTPWHNQLKKKGLLVPVEPPLDIDPKGGECVAITPLGWLAIGVLLAKAPAPDEVLTRFGMLPVATSPVDTTQDVDPAHPSSSNPSKK